MKWISEKAFQPNARMLLSPFDPPMTKYSAKLHNLLYGWVKIHHNTSIVFKMISTIQTANALRRMYWVLTRSQLSGEGIGETEMLWGWVKVHYAGMQHIVAHSIHKERECLWECWNIWECNTRENTWGHGQLWKQVGKMKGEVAWWWKCFKRTFGSHR